LLDIDIYGRVAFHLVDSQLNSNTKKRWPSFDVDARHL